ncbi:hypothetical protein B0H19DRAFT_1244582, partial [Mycena capillaripes]
SIEVNLTPLESQQVPGRGEARGEGERERWILPLPITHQHSIRSCFPPSWSAPRCSQVRPARLSCLQYPNGIHTKREQISAARCLNLRRALAPNLQLRPDFGYSGQLGFAQPVFLEAATEVLTISAWLRLCDSLDLFLPRIQSSSLFPGIVLRGPHSTGAALFCSTKWGLSSCHSRR